MNENIQFNMEVLTLFCIIFVCSPNSVCTVTINRDAVL